MAASKAASFNIRFVLTRTKSTKDVGALVTTTIMCDVIPFIAVILWLLLKNLGPSVA